MHRQSATPAYDTRAVEQPLISCIEGSRLNAVEFFGEREGPILLQFPEGRLEVLAAARLVLDSHEADARSEPARLALRARVSRRVAKVTLEVGGRLEIDFDDGARFIVSLAGAGQAGRESAAFFDENWVCQSY